MKDGWKRSVAGVACFICLASLLGCFPLPAGRAGAAVLVTDGELAAARENVNKEPLRGYFEKLVRTGDADAAPFLYLLSGEREYALKARTTVFDNLDYLREYIPYMVDIWILHSPGRVVSALLAYDMTRDSGVYTEKEVEEIKDTLFWCVRHYLNEGRDHIGRGFLYQTDYIPEDMEEWVVANMNVHRLLAVGLYGLVFPGEPRSGEIIEYAVDYFERVLCLGSRPGGAWAENPRYMGGVLRELYMLAAGLKNAGERDFFEDERFKRMLGFFAESIPAPGIEHPHRPTMVAADDAHWWENRTAILGWAAARYHGENPKLAGEWTWCWRKSGSPLTPESLLFVDPGIEPVKPDYGSYLPGMGYVILRDRFAEPDETFFFATFGPEYGTSNKTMHHSPCHGDFSIIWRGYPLFLTRGCSSYLWSRRMRDQVDFARNVVTFDGAGGSIAIPERKYAGPAVEVNTTFDESLVRDYYPDGVTNFVSSEGFEYAAGEVRNWDMSLPAPFNVRHFLFLKPDVFVVWDQVRSPYPLQWNFHMPAESVVKQGKKIELTSWDGVRLAVDFLQDEPLDVTFDWPLESIRTDWPMVLSCPYGKGMFIFNALDIARQVLEHDHDGARRILENLLCYPSRPERIGLIETDGQTAAVLEKLGFSYELLDYDDLAGDLSRFDRIVVGHFAVLVRDRDLCDYREKLWKYVEDGGVCYWAYQYAWGWKPGDTSGPGYFPKMLMVGEGTSVLWGEGIELHRPVSMDGSPLWERPNRITPGDWKGWYVDGPDTFKVMPPYPLLPNTDRARNFPVYYSDYWRVHASALKTYNINVPPTRSRFGPYRWIKVHHKASDDFLAVFRPWKEGVAGGLPAEIIKGKENEVLIRQDGDYWWLFLGKHAGFDGNIALLRYRGNSLTVRKRPSGEYDVYERQRFDAAPVEFLLADTVEAEFGGMRFVFSHPATVSCNLGERRGTISILDGGRVSLPWEAERVLLSGRRLDAERTDGGVGFDLPPGEFDFRFPRKVLELTVRSHVARVEVVTPGGEPVRWVHVFRDLPGEGRTWFQGATDAHGKLTLRWKGARKQTVSLEKGGTSIMETIEPGIRRIVFPSGSGVRR